MPLHTTRHGFLGLLGALALTACAGGLPETPPPADAVAGPSSLYSLSPGTPVDGTLQLTLQRGQNVARGTLSTNGERFPVTLTGLTAQAGNAARVEAAGQVYGLPRGGVSFPGTFSVVNDPAAAATDVVGGLRLGNENLVLVVLQPRREGVVLTAAAGGVVAALGR